jgi:hypothetical protein
MLNVAAQYVITKVTEKQVALEMHWLNQLLAHVDVNLLSRNINYHNAD